MAAPSYTTDLTTIDDADAITGWAEATAAGWTDGKSEAADADYPYIEGNTAISCQMTKTGVCCLLYNNGTGITVPTDGAYLVWLIFSSPVVDTVANGGYRVVVGNSLAAFYGWTVGGSDFGKQPYGGWENFAVNPTETADYTAGTPTATEQYVGGACKTTGGISKGNPFAIDKIQYGRCELRVNQGDVTPNGPATFAGMAAANDGTTARWGLFQAIAGGYLWKGKITLGYNSTTVYFVDSDVNIILDDTPKCTSAFNYISIETSGSTVTWTNVIITALGTQSRGTVVVTAGTVTWTSCQFVGMLDFTFLSSSTINVCIFRGCNTITAPGSDMQNSQVLVPTVAADASALVWNVATDPNGKLDGMTFTKGSNAHHAIEFGLSSPLSMSLTDMTFTGFNASDAQNDSVLYFARTSGTITVNVAGSPSYKSAGATVNIVGPSVTATVTCVTQAGGDIQNARVLLKAADGTGPFPYQESVTIVNAGTLATVTHTGHGLTTNDKVLIDGASHWENNGVFQITYINANSYSYTLPSAPGSSPTGTITSTFVALEGLTDVNGEISMTRNFPTDQPVDGWARKSSGSPYYKSSSIGGTVDADDGFAATVVMVADE